MHPQSPPLGLCGITTLNCELIDSLTDNEYREKENEIIQLFNGTRNMLQIILQQNKNNLTYLQQYQLSNTLIFGREYGDNLKQNALSVLGEDCIGKIYTFLSREDTAYLNKCCRCLHRCYHNKHVSCPQFAAFSEHSLVYFIHKLCKYAVDVNETPAFISWSSEFFKWIIQNVSVTDLEELKHRRHVIANVLCHSGLLPIFAQLVSNDEVITNHPQLIKNILNVFTLILKLRTDHDMWAHFVFDALIIEHIGSLLDKSHYWIKDIINLLKCASCFEPHRVFNAFQQIMAQLKNAPALNIRNYSQLLTIIRNLRLVIKQWKALFILSKAFIEISKDATKKIKSLIDVSSSKKWVSELGAGDAVFIRSDEDLNVRVFDIKEVVKLPDECNWSATATFVGVFNDIYLGREVPESGPFQQIEVELSSLLVIDEEDQYSSFYQRLMEPIEIISAILITHLISRDSQEMLQLRDIIKTSQKQCYKYSVRDILFGLAQCDWSYIQWFLRDEIRAEFTVHGGTIEFLWIVIRDERSDLLRFLTFQWVKDTVRDCIDFFQSDASASATPESATRLLEVLLSAYRHTPTHYWALRIFITQIYERSLIDYIRLHSFIDCIRFLIEVSSHISHICYTRISTYNTCYSPLLQRCKVILRRCLAENNDYSQLAVALNQIYHPQLTVYLSHLVGDAVVRATKICWEILCDCLGSDDDINVIHEMNSFINKFGLNRDWFHANVSPDERNNLRNKVTTLELQSNLEHELLQNILNIL